MCAVVILIAIPGKARRFGFLGIRDQSCFLRTFSNVAFEIDFKRGKYIATVYEL